MTKLQNPIYLNLNSARLQCLIATVHVNNNMRSKTVTLQLAPQQKRVSEALG